MVTTDIFFFGFIVATILPSVATELAVVANIQIIALLDFL